MADPRVKPVQFLRQCAARGFARGELDCGLFLADWAMAVSGLPDPCPELRKLTDDEWRTHARNLPVVVARICRRIGARRVAPDVSSAGDIGVVALHLTAPTGAIRTAQGWAFLTATGIVNGPLRERDRVLAAWRLA